MADEQTAGTNQNTGTADATTSLLTSSESAATESTKTQTDTAAVEGTKQTEKGAETTTEATKTEAKSEETKAGAPEKYEFAVEGVTLNPKALEQFEPIARELNLTNDQANKLVALQAKVVAEQSQAATEAWMNTRKEWVNQVKADKEIGGANLDVSLTNARKVVKDFGTPALAKLLDDYGLGDHPEVIRMFAKIGKMRAEDDFKTSTSGGGRKSSEEVLYGKGD